MKRSGFTLLELLIVIAIIVCIAAIAIPALILVMNAQFTFGHVAFNHPVYYEE
jgi:prepilin-type N-terminal cleavage/methylation domain-containing protein